MVSPPSSKDGRGHNLSCLDSQQCQRCQFSWRFHNFGDERRNRHFQSFLGSLEQARGIQGCSIQREYHNGRGKEVEDWFVETKGRWRPPLRGPDCAEWWNPCVWEGGVKIYPGSMRMPAPVHVTKTTCLSLRAQEYQPWQMVALSVSIRDWWLLTWDRRGPSFLHASSDWLPIRFGCTVVQWPTVDIDSEALHLSYSAEDYYAYRVTPNSMILWRT